MLILLLIWVALSLALLYFGIGRQKTGGALTLPYFLGLSLMHVPGALVYLESWSEFIDEGETTLGFELTIIGMAAFVSGAIVVRVFGKRVAMAKGISQAQQVALAHLSRELLIVGFL